VFVLEVLLVGFWIGHLGLADNALERERFGGGCFLIG
jgi:hypothetical protein